MSPREPNGVSPQKPGWVDLHVHYLPGVDDGAASLEETVEMLRLAYQSGTRTLVATPHMFLPPWNHEHPAGLVGAFAELRASLERATHQPGGAFLEQLELFLGAEHYVSPELFSALEKGRVLPLAGGRHLLIELPPFLSAEAAKTATSRISEAGYLPILAHIERSDFVHRHPERLAEVLIPGAMAQVNASSVLGKHGRRVRRLAHQLLDSGLVSVIASDGHGTHSRRPDLGAVRAALERYGEESTRRWLVDNPRSALTSAPAGESRSK